MELEIYETENKHRNDYEIIDDKYLLNWTPNSQKEFIPLCGPEIFVGNKATETNFISKHEFNRRFQLFTQGTLNYIDWSNVIVAGGCVSNTINGYVSTKDVDNSDVDLFLYDLTTDEACKKISQLITDISNAINDRFGGSTCILKNNYTITVINKANDRNIKVQIILRLYKCVYEVLAGFDVDSCAVSYNGQKVQLTARSLNAFQTRMNVVDLSRRSPSYEHRLHKYVDRGFGIYIPFDWANYNRLYFLNRNTQGLDRLLILQRYNRRPGLQKLLNYITKRRNIKFTKKPISDYDNDQLDMTPKESIRHAISRFNHRVSEPYQYTVYELEEFVNACPVLTFMVHDPGQQLTGSFNPIHSKDWVYCNYQALGIDHIGRNTTLLKIKRGAVMNLEELYDISVMDNSLFNILDYLVMYHPNEELLTQAWDNRHRFRFNSNNLYNISVLELAMICHRYTLVQHILASAGSNNRLPITWQQAINLALFLDDLKLLKCVYHYHKNNIYDQRDTVKLYRCNRIGKYFGLQLEAKDTSLTSCLDGKTAPERIDYILTRKPTPEEYRALLAVGDYQRFTDDEIRLYSAQCRDWFLSLLVKDLRRQVVIDDLYYQVYPSDSFAAMWVNCCREKMVKTEAVKDEQRHTRALSLSMQFYPIKEVERITKVVFKDPIVDISPVVLLKMTKIWEGDYTNLDINIWAENTENEYYRELLFVLDDLAVVKQFVKADHLAGFLGKWQTKLGSQLQQELKKLKTQQISLGTELHRNYSKAICNTLEHLSVLESGKLLSTNVLVENAFGQTPFDYAIGQLLHLYSKDALTDVELEQLINLRETSSEIDYDQKRYVGCTPEMVTNPELDMLVNRI